MAPVEGERRFEGKFAGRIDSTEPGSVQPLLDYFPAKLYIGCDLGDSMGTFRAEGDTKNMRVYNLRQPGNATEVEDFVEPISFSGSQKVIVVVRQAEVFSETLILWHKPGEADLPPYRSERVPVDPRPPLDEDTVEVVPESQRQSSPVAVSSKS